MANLRVILQFDNFQKRDDWAAQNPAVAGLRVYKRDPWVAAELPEAQVNRLRQSPDLKVHADIKMSPTSSLTA
jgi:hypothetical protein